MGFFIGWKFFEWKDYYSFEAQQERDFQRDSQKNRDEANRRRRQKERKAKLEKKKRQREETYRESEAYQEMFNQQHGGSNGVNVDGETGNAAFYNNYGSDNKEGYREEIARRYGTLYNSNVDGKAPEVSRGLGAGPTQKVTRNQKVRFHAETGPLAKRIRVPLGRDAFNPNSDTQHNPNSGRRGGGKKGGGGNGNSGGGGLNRPF